MKIAAKLMQLINIFFFIGLLLLLTKKPRSFQYQEN